MDLGDLIEELRENILHDRSNLISGASDYLWSDRTLVRYINEAQMRMAREASVLRDTFELRTRAFEKEYRLPASTLAVISVKCQGDKADLARASHATLSTYHMPDTYFFDPSSLNSLPPGKIRAFDTDEFLSKDKHGSLGVMNLRIYPVPDPLHVQTLFIRCLRLPDRLHLKCKDLRDLSEEDREHFCRQVPEIPAEHHMDMLDWAAHLALRIVDRDGGDPERAADFAASFEAKVLEAKSNMMRKLFAPEAWSFGRNGFSWEQN